MSAFTKSRPLQKQRCAVKVFKDGSLTWQADVLHCNFLHWNKMKKISLKMRQHIFFQSTKERVGYNFRTFPFPSQQIKKTLRKKKTVKKEQNKSNDRQKLPKSVDNDRSVGKTAVCFYLRLRLIWAERRCALLDAVCEPGDGHNSTLGGRGQLLLVRSSSCYQSLGILHQALRRLQDDLPANPYKNTKSVSFHINAVLQSHNHNQQQPHEKCWDTPNDFQVILVSPY